MKARLLAAVMAAVVMGDWLADRAAGQQRPMAAPLAIVDINYIFKNHTAFQALRNEIKNEMDAIENEINGARDALVKLEQRLANYNKGTPEYKQLDEEIVRRRAELTVQFNKRRRDLQDREAQIYYDTYQQILDNVRYYAESAGILMVQQFNGNPIDRNEPQNLLRDLNRSVIYHHPQIDITPIILERVRGQAPGVPALGRPSQPQQGVFPR